MHLKSCCALLLLALVACQAAPSTSKNIEKKSISEKTSKIEKDDMKMEDPGTDKDRAKKSTTFCVEVRDGAQHQVPCQEGQQSVVMVQPEPQKALLHQSQQAYLNVPLKYIEAQQPPQPIRMIHPQPQPQAVQVQPLPPPAASPVYVMPPPQYHLPPVQTLPSQQAPIVNILTPPAAPCNVMPAMAHEEQKNKSSKEVEHIKPLPRPEPQKPKPQSMELVAPCEQELIVLPPKPIAVYPKKQWAVQVAEMERRPEPLALEAECTCSQKGYPMGRNHKVHEHHVVLHPPSNVAAGSLVLQPPCPMNYLSNNQPAVFGEYPRTTYGDTVISLHQERPHTYYPNVYPNLNSMKSPGYSSYPMKTYDSPVYASPSVTVNAFSEQTGIFRQAQSSSQDLSTKHLPLHAENNKLEQKHSIVPTMMPTGTSKREVDSIRLEQQTNMQQQAVEPSKTSVEMKIGEQGSMM